METRILFQKKVSLCVLEQYSKAKFSPRSCKNSFALSQENVSSIQEFSDTVCIFLNKYVFAKMFTGLQDTSVTKGDHINFTGKYILIKNGLPQFSKICT